MQNLNVYRASAGSGKTFTLAVEYIRLLVIDPTNYRHILAVTFTNKATGEMKDRIVTKLHGLACADGTADDYMKQLLDRFKQEGKNFTRDYISAQARLALDHIIHDYSHFRIETIDAFFQSVVRQLARELNLTANLRVDLNQDDALAEAVQAMIDSIGDDKDTHDAISSFVSDNIDSDAKWGIAKTMTDFSKHIFKEEYLKNKDLLNGKTNPQAYRTFKKHLRQLSDRLTSEESAFGNEFIDFCNQHGLDVSDFCNGKSTRGIWLFFEKLSLGQSPNVSPAVRGYLINHWLKDEANQMYESQLVDLLNRTIDCIEKHAQMKAGIRLLLANLNKTMLLSKVNEKLRTLNEEADRFLLADTAYFLRELIGDSDIPFIYEKAGTEFHYIMIDEFQDTSELQWDNFKPLISNSISAGHGCLLVGDVKQSIYRWRNSDWNILNNIDKGDFHQMVNIKPLDTNYRSAKRVVEFNNDFFEKAGGVIKEKFTELCPDAAELTVAIQNAYKDVKQKIHDEVEGYVEVVIDENEDEGRKFKDDVYVRLGEQINDMLGKGVKPGDMAILARRGDDVRDISSYLTEVLPDNVSIISNEAFMLESSPAIMILIGALTVLSAPDDRFARLLLAYRCLSQGVTHIDSPISVQQLFASSDETVNQYLPAEFVEKESRLAYLPLYELCEQLASIFSVDKMKGQDAYLFCFMDELSAFVHDRPATIALFLKYWADVLHETTIPSVASDGIQVMTIHKSKGLEFHTVFVPFCTWPVEVAKIPTLWCKPHSQEFSEIPLVALDFGNDMSASEFHDEYDHEQLKTFVDNLNLMYVAFTRATRNLFIYTGRDVIKNNDGENRKCKYSCFDVLKSVFADDVMRFGNICYAEPKKEQEQELDGGNTAQEPLQPEGEATENANDDETSQGLLVVKFSNTPVSAEFRQSNKSRDFINGEDAEHTDYYINKGLVIHKIMEMITVPEDVERVMLQLDCEGAFPDADFRRDIDATMSDAFADCRVRRWFSPEWTVLNECSILFTDDGGNVLSRRPDRVICNGDETIVIDYKTGRQSDEHIRQVELYIDLLRQMDYPNVHGYLWYINRKDIVDL